MQAYKEQDNDRMEDDLGNTENRIVNQRLYRGPIASRVQDITRQGYDLEDEIAQNREQYFR